MEFILTIGSLLLVAAGVVYVIQHPDILGAIQNVIKAGKGALAAPQRSKKIGFRVGEDEAVTARMQNLDPNTLLTIRDPDTGRDVELQVVTRETLVGQYKYGSSKEWRPSGDRWQALLCQAEPRWSRTSVLLVRLDTMGYLLKRRVLGPEEASQFASQAQAFAHSGQVAGSHSVTFAGKKFAIQDVGVWVVEALDDKPHLPVGVLARWIVAHGADETAIFVEDGKGNNDSVWQGWVVDLDRVVTDVLTPDGS